MHDAGKKILNDKVSQNVTLDKMDDVEKKSAVT